MASDLLRKEFVCVTLNNNGGPAADGEKGRFLESLKCTEGNYMHVATADGRVLFGGHLSGVNQDVEGALRGVLKKWRALPESVRKPGAVHLARPKEDPKQELIQPPPGGLVLRVYQRVMKRDEKGALALITKRDVKNRAFFPDEAWQYAGALMTEPMPDIMWITEGEWKALIPATPKKGDQAAVPAPVAMRLFRYHLINGTTGMPLWRWERSEVVRGELTLTVEEVSPVLRLRLHGSALIATNGNPTKAERGYDAQLTGILEYDPGKKAISRFDFVAVGDWWGGDWEGNRFARPGRNPLGIAFELARGDRASDFVPPNGGYFKDRASRYFAADR